MDNQEQWIPIEERLPEKGQQVLVSCDSGYVTYDYYDSLLPYGVKDKWFTSFYNSEEKVIAWMPLPKPYKK